jgi:hypothetical protein
MAIDQSLSNLKLNNMITKFLKKVGGVILGLVTLGMLMWFGIECYLALLFVAV